MNQSLNNMNDTPSHRSNTKLKAVNSWITLLANIGVIAGLVFLAYEVRQNTSQLRAEASFNINQSVSAHNSAVYNSPVLADILIRGDSSFKSLDPTDQSQFMAFQFDRINLGVYILQLEREGISEVHFPYIDYLVQDFHSKPGLQQFLLAIENSWVGDKELYFMLRKDNQ